MQPTKLAMTFFSLGFLALTGCPALDIPGGLGGLGGVNNDIVGEVQAIDSRNREIVIRTDTGRKMLLRYDNNTQVIYRQRNYAVTNLERGDYVAARVQQDRDGRLSTANITVKEAAQDRGVSRLDQVEGLVENIDSRRGTFEIRDRRDRVIVVAIAFNAPRAVTDRFNRLRNGDYVRIEGRGVSAERFDLENFL